MEIDDIQIPGQKLWVQSQGRPRIEKVAVDSRQVKPGSIYVAVVGHKQDGHDFIPHALCRGAVALVVEKKEKVPPSFHGAVFQVPSSPLALQFLCQQFYGHPGDLMTSVAVTGTNGKTSFSHIFESLCRSVGVACGVIGTIRHYLGQKVWPTLLTTPNPVVLQERLKNFLDLKAQAFVLEASSHALKQKRLLQPLDLCVFTNLSRDHGDYHSSEEDYFLSKAQLFGPEMMKKKGPGLALINGDDPRGYELSKKTPRKCFFYGQGKDCHFTWRVEKESLEGTTFLWKNPRGEHQIQSPLLGLHNVYNLVAALGALYLLGINYEKSIASIKALPGVPGRLQLCGFKKQIRAFVDYAHTEEALRVVLTTLKKQIGDSGGKIRTVFGCGGNRDPRKRKFMGEVAESLSHQVFLTSDNSRGENTMDIIRDICSGCRSSSPRVEIEPNRRKAIQKAVASALPGDIILVAGKGHEEYQIVGNKKEFFSDCEEIQKAFSRMPPL